MKKLFALIASLTFSIGVLYGQGSPSSSSSFDWNPVPDLTWGTEYGFEPSVGLTVNAQESPAGSPAIPGLKTLALAYNGTENLANGYTFSFKLSDFVATNTQSALFISVFNPTDSVLVDPSKCFVFEINYDTDGISHYFYSPRWGFGNTTDSPDTQPVFDGSEWAWSADEEITLRYNIENYTNLTVEVTYLDAVTGEYETYTSQTFTLDSLVEDLTQLIGFNGSDDAPYIETTSMYVTNFEVPEPSVFAVAFGALALAFAAWRKRK